MSMTEDEKKMLIEIHEACVGKADGSVRGYGVRLCILEAWKSNVTKILAAILSIIGASLVNHFFKLF